ncbi:MAG: ABC transporter substrate-binding protein [Spirochaetaceae bacterium]|nr:MAG: ABC transporter substrate-binding protein [Spirochaetaceae bacterium]
MAATKTRRSLAGLAAAAAVAVMVVVACGGREELTEDEALALRAQRRDEILQGTVERHGGEEFAPGVVGGTWTASINNDPRTFNTLTARDGDSGTVISGLFDYLADYDAYKREWKPNLASFEIEADEARDEMRVVFTLREDLYWTTPGQAREEGVKVTSDDVIFWYNEINGDPELQQPGYAQQFIEMPDGSRGRIRIERIDDRRFAFVYPRVVAEPVLSSNMIFGPRYVYEPAKQEGGVEAVLNLFSVDTDVRTIPSIGQYHIVEYNPGVRVVLNRNPNYWKTDDEGTTLPYIERLIFRVVPDRNTEYLLFRDGSKDSYTPRPEDLEELITARDRDYTVYDGGQALGSSFITFNQNPRNMNPVVYSWFIQTEFRQAMSSLLNRDRIAAQVYRGLAKPAEHFFATANPMFDPDIRLQYTFNPERAVELLASIAITRGPDGLMYDADGNHIEFTMNVGVENEIWVDIMNIFADELSEVGITARIRPIDFQNLVERLTSTYDWEVVGVALGVNYWPSSGSNVWQSSGNFHLWHPLQESPATEWETRVDYLYNEGRFTIDPERRKEIYDEYQRILLSELPVMYIVHPLSFLAVRDRWDNVYYDTLGGFQLEYVFLKQ